MTMMATNRVTPWIIGRSCEFAADTIRSPMPDIEKVTSTNTAPTSRCDSSIALMPRIGMSALRST